MRNNELLNCVFSYLIENNRCIAEFLTDFIDNIHELAFDIANSNNRVYQENKINELIAMTETSSYDFFAKLVGLDEERSNEKQSKHPEDIVWQCGCGCASYFICKNGVFQCIECGKFLKPEDVPDITLELKRYFEVVK